MHTATQLNTSQFSVSIDGVVATREDLFPGWGESDRLGVIIDRPLGALGASLAIQLGITLFYDVAPKRRKSTLYPEVYLFHVGGRFGDFSNFDIFPPRKEVFLADAPAMILEALNDRAISRLLVVEGEVGQAQHHFKEPASAYDRIKSVLAYSPSGAVHNSDVVIDGLSRRVEVNAKNTIHPPAEAYGAASPAVDEGASGVKMHGNEIIPPWTNRSEEVVEFDRLKAKKQFEKKKADGHIRESYRRVSLSDALNMLSSASAR